MISDVIISIYNGYENKAQVIDDLLKRNYYDCCLKSGTDIINQSIIKQDTQIVLKIIPTCILYGIPCLIGIGGTINIESLNSEINVLLKFNIDIHKLLYIDDNATIIHKDSKLKYGDIHFLKLKTIFVYPPIKTTVNNFLLYYNRPLYEGANGFYSYNGNSFKNSDTLNTTTVYSKINPKLIGNIIGVANIFECYKSQSKEHINEIYSVYEEFNYRNNSIISIDDLLLSFNWINLDKLKSAIMQTGVNIVYILGLKVLEKLTKYEIYTNKSKIEFDNITEFKEYIIYTLDSIEGVSEVIML
jgi:hypothetical protein